MFIFKKIRLRSLCGHEDYQLYVKNNQHDF